MMVHVMLTVQYLRQAGARLAEPEKRLALAVLRTVVYDCNAATERANCRARARKRQAYERALAYVASCERRTYSFENLCDTVGVDGGHLRRGIERVQESSA